MSTINTMEETPSTAGVSQIFNSFLQQRNAGHLNPPVDIINDTTTLKIFMDIPGINPDSLDVDFYNNKIEISGERERPWTTTIPTRKEITYGDFTKKIIIPISVTNKASVVLVAKNGVLIITIDKTIEERNRFSIKVENEESKED